MVGESSGGMKSYFTKSMPKSYRKYAQVDTSSYQGKWGLYKVSDSEIIEGQKTVQII